MPFRLGESPRIRHEDARDEPAVDPKSERIVNNNISVIIPSYNAEHYIGEALDSVLCQTRAAAEIIVVDDASTDGTVEIARLQSSRVRVIANAKNAGPGVRRNQGVMASSGEYIAFLDADDKWTPQHLANLGSLLDRYTPVGLAFCPIRFFGDRTGQLPQDVGPYLEPRNCFFDMLRNLPCVPSSSLVRRTVHDAVGGFDETPHLFRGRRVQAEDLDYAIRAARIAHVAACPEPTVWYRWHGGQASALRNEQIVVSFAYRLQILDWLAASDAGADDLAPAQDRVLRCWEEHIEDMWRTRNSPGLRKMARFGLRKPLLARATRPYMWKALLPQALARWI